METQHVGQCWYCMSTTRMGSCIYAYQVETQDFLTRMQHHNNMQHHTNNAMCCCQRWQYISVELQMHLNGSSLLGIVVLGVVMLLVIGVIVSFED